jgi:ABC-type dipeptide/oligopeptide/nickel transport system ATPase component
VRTRASHGPVKRNVSCGCSKEPVFRRRKRFYRRFPRQMSVGQAQRVLIVMALLHAPPLLIADEPTSALDVKREVLDLLANIAAERQMSMLFISHDLPTVAAICHRLAILHTGEIVECGPVRQMLANPQHPYTRQLIAAAPKWL